MFLKSRAALFDPAGRCEWLHLTGHVYFLIIGQSKFTATATPDTLKALASLGFRSGGTDPPAPIDPALADQTPNLEEFQWVSESRAGLENALDICPVEARVRDITHSSGWPLAVQSHTK